MDYPHVTVDDLWHYTAQVTVGGRALTLRALSDLQVQARDEYAMLAMVRRRRALNDPTTELHELYMDSIDRASDEELRQTIRLATQNELAREAAESITPALIPFPDAADDAEKAETLSAREREDARVLAARKKFVEERLERLEQELQQGDFDRAKLLAVTRQKQLEAQARVAMVRAFYDYTLYASVFTDAACQTRLFAEPGAVSDLTPRERDELISACFRELDRISARDVQYFLSTGDSTGSSPTSSLPDGASASASKSPKKSPGGSRKRG